MLARKSIPPEYQAWNARWRAPFGPQWARRLSLSRKLKDDVAPKLGPFGFQRNNTTREFEYPWVYFTAAAPRGSRVLEIGGAFSGLQFVLAREGADVTNVDPFNDYGASEKYPAGPEAIHARLNGLFGTSVRLARSSLPQSGLPEGSFDAAVSVSTIEHLPWQEVRDTVQAVHRLLKPGGLFVLTVDLFLDAHPFANRVENQWGTNVSIHQLVAESGMTLVAGREDELYGFPSFDPERINRGRDDYLIGFPAMVQTLVLRKE